MLTVAEHFENKLPRFQKSSSEKVYRLFNAFVQKTFVENKAIDFSKPIIEHEDGSLEFESLEKSFKDLLNSVPVVDSMPCLTVSKLAKKPEKKSMPKEPQLKRTSKDTDETFAKKQAEFPEKLKSYQKKLKEYEEYLKNFDEAKFQEECKAYEEFLNNSEELLSTLELVRAHLNWIWSLGKELGLEASSVIRDKNIEFACGIFKRFITSLIYDSCTDVDTMKQELLKFCYKASSTTDFAIRHCLEHLCNPNVNIALFSVDEKLRILKEHESIARAIRFKQPMYYEGYALYYKDVKRGYYSACTEDRICQIFDVYAKGEKIQNMQIDDAVAKFIL